MTRTMLGARFAAALAIGAAGWASATPPDAKIETAAGHRAKSGSGLNRKRKRTPANAAATGGIEEFAICPFTSPSTVHRDAAPSPRSEAFRGEGAAAPFIGIGPFRMHAHGSGDIGILSIPLSLH